MLVHATPVGSELAGASADDIPIPAEWLRPETLVLDAVYRPVRTALLVAANARGCTAVPGAEWFVRQALLQFEHFTHQKPDEDFMRSSFEHALGLSSGAEAAAGNAPGGGA